MKAGKWLLLSLCLFLCACTTNKEIDKTDQQGEIQSAPIILSGREWSENSTELELGRDCTLSALQEVLPMLPMVETIQWKDCPLSTGEKLSLYESYPHISFVWPLQLGVSTFSSADPVVMLGGEEKNIPALLELLPLMKAERIDLYGWDISVEEALALRERGGDKSFIYTVSLYGRAFSTDSTEIDLSEMEITDTKELEQALIHFPQLEKVLMIHCGLDNDTMDELNLRHEGIDFVWMVQVMTVAIRSDRTYFSIYNPDERCFSRESVQNLRYCHDLVAVDLGHCGIGQEDLEFVRGCPKLEFLIIAESYCHNLEPLRACPNLRYLEAFKSYLSDISALKDCPKLTDLNLCYIPSLGPSCVEVLSEMKQLEHLWFCDANFSAQLIIQLQDSLPNTEFLYHKGPESTGNGWRTHDIYYEMRDALHMPYME